MGILDTYGKLISLIENWSLSEKKVLIFYYSYFAVIIIIIGDDKKFKVCFIFNTEKKNLDENNFMIHRVIIFWRENRKAEK